MGYQSLEDSEETAGARDTNSPGMLPPPYFSLSTGRVGYTPSHRDRRNQKIIASGTLHADFFG